MFTNCRAPTAHAGQTRRRGRRKELVVHPRRFLELKARPSFAAARTSVVVTGGSRAERSDAITCGFPHTPRHPYRQPAADAALEPCSATKTSSCSERNESSSSRNTRTATAGAARPGIDPHQPGFTLCFLTLDYFVQAGRGPCRGAAARHPCTPSLTRTRSPRRPGGGHQQASLPGTSTVRAF